MRRYRDLIVPPDDLGPTLDWWDALPIVTEVMNLVRAGDAGGATDLLRWGLCARHRSFGGGMLISGTLVS